jgi:hypothetical protein
LKYWLGIAYLITHKNKIIITGENGFTIELITQDNNFNFKSLDNINNIEVKNMKIIKYHNKKIMGFNSFISNIALLLKRHVRDKGIKNGELNIFYKNIFSLLKQFLKE